MNITKLKVSGRAQGNGEPRSGDVWFDDGCSYGFMWDGWKGKWFFVTSAKRPHGCGFHAKSFYSQKRAALLADHLNTV